MVEFYINGFSALTGDAAVEDFTPYVEARKLRRMEKIAKNALLCSYRAFNQAGLEINAPKDTGLSVAVGAGSLESTCKFMDTIIDDGDELSSPTAFAGSVHNSTGLTLSLFLHLSGPCVTTGQFDSSFAGAFLTGIQFLKKGMCQTALVVAAEDVNPVCAQMAPQNEALFSSVVRAVHAPFERAAAAFLISLHPTPQTLFAVNQFSFTRTDEYPMCEAPLSTPSWGALQLAELLSKAGKVSFTDVFGGSKFTLQAEPYANQK